MSYFPRQISGRVAMMAVAAAAPLLFPPAALQAQDSGNSAQSAEAADLAKQIQNPLATVVTVPFQYNLNQGVGEFDRTITNLNFQPVIPFPGETWNLISRSILPFVSIPSGETEAETGLADLTTTLFVSPAQPGKLIWGVGPALVLPTASNPEVMGSGKLSLGPAAILFTSAGSFTFGAVAWNVWSILGDSDRESVSQLTTQYFVNFNFGEGWALGTAPIITCDWKAPSGDQCTVPWGLQLSKVLKFGSRPVNLLAGYYYNSEHPEGGADEQIRIQVNLLYPQAPN